LTLAAEEEALLRTIPLKLKAEFYWRCVLVEGWEQWPRTCKGSNRLVKGRNAEKILQVKSVYLTKRFQVYSEVEVERTQFRQLNFATSEMNW